MEHRDVVVVGAGPAGSACAWKLRQSGVEGLVVDRMNFPRDKTCAGWITPAVLDIMGIRADQYQRGRVLEPIVGFRVGVIGGRSIEVPFDRPVSYGVRRCEFDQYLIERSGVDFRPATAVSSLCRDGSRWILNDQIETPVVVGAGGHFCAVARAVNPPAGREPVVVTQEVEIPLEGLTECSARPGIPEFYFTPDFKGYGWVFRKGRYVTVGLGRRDQNHLHHHLRRFLEFLGRHGRVGGLEKVAWKGHAYLLYGSSPRRIVDDGVLLVGDAAGLAHPRSGEGIGPAVESGVLAAETILDARGDFRRIKLEGYLRRLHERFGAPVSPRVWSRAVPERAAVFIARRLLSSPWFVRRILLERWFLHAA